MTESDRNGSRPSHVVLADALEELRGREDRLVSFERELLDVRKAIKILERAGGATAPQTQAPKGETKRLILEQLERSKEPMTVEDVAAALGRKPAGWLSMQLNRMANAREIVSYAGGRYGLKSGGKNGDVGERNLDAVALDAAGVDQL